LTRLECAFEKLRLFNLLLHDSLVYDITKFTKTTVADFCMDLLKPLDVFKASVLIINAVIDAAEDVDN